MRISGLGSSTWPTSPPDSTTCGVNPCGWLDNVGSVIGQASNSCSEFMACALPNDPTTIALNKSLVAGAATAIGQDVGNTAGDVFSGLVGGGMGGWIFLGGLFLAGVILLKK